MSLPIADPQAELHVLGAFAEAESWADERKAAQIRGDILRTVDDEAFAVAAHREVFAVLRSLLRARMPIDVPTVTQRLRSQEAKVAFLTASEMGVGNVASGPTSAARVLDLAERRRLRQLGQEIARMAGESLDVEGHTSEIRSTITRALTRQKGDAVTDGISDAGAAFAEIERRLEHGAPPGVHIGFGPFNDLGGADRGLPLVVMGRPASGKTGFGVTAMFNAAMAGHEAMMVSLEMTRLDLWTRAMSGLSKVPLQRLRNPKQSMTNPADDFHRIGRALKEQDEALKRLRTFAPDRASIAQLEDVILAEHAIRPLDLVVVDYLTQIRAPSERTREREVAKISDTLRVLAKATGACFMILAQMNRGIESREPPVPLMSDLRDSGQIEQDAGTVIALSQWDPEGKVDENTGKRDVLEGERRVYFLKRRNHRAGLVHRLKFRGDCGGWCEDLEIWP